MYGYLVMFVLSFLMNVGSNSSNGNRTRRRGNRVSVNREIQLERRRLRDMISGRELIPSEMPPVLRYTPWNNLTVRYKSASTTQLTVTLVDIQAWICRQVGLAKTTVSGATYIPIEVRFQNIQIWKLGDGQLTLYPCDFLSPDKEMELTRFDSFSQKNMYARVGYEWPAAHQSMVFKADGSSTSLNRKLFVLVNGPAASCEIHLKVLWRPGYTPLDMTGTSTDFPSSTSSIEDLAQPSMSDLMDRLTILEAQIEERK